MELSQAVHQAIERLVGAGQVEVRENGAWLATLEGFKYEVRRQGGTPLLHLWSAETDLVLRVLQLADEVPGQLTLEVARLGRTRTDRLEFVAAGGGHRSGRETREKFRARFHDLLAQHFPDETEVSLATAAKLQHSLSGNYARGILHAGPRAWAVLGTAPGESAATYDGLLTFGLLWLDRTIHSARRKTVAGLRLFFPIGAGRATIHRLQALSPSITVELYEYSDETWRARWVDVRDAGNSETRLVARRETESILSRAATDIAHVAKIASRTNDDAIVAEVIPGTNEVALRFRGLSFARSAPEGLFFGLADAQRPLTPEREPELGRLIEQLRTYRSATATATKHPLYRAQPERWLETLVAADPARVDARLDQRFLYTQVPHFAAGDRGVMDLLGVTRGGRLCVIELKVSEDPQLLLQGVDYWLRVLWHHTHQDFQRYGYFPGVLLDPRPPLLFLVAPSLRFHAAMDVLLPFLKDEIEVCRVGVSETWRRGLKVVLRQNRV